MQDMNHFVSGNWELFVALAIILFLLARTWLGPGAIAMLLPAEVVRLINHKDALVVDVRTEKEYQQGHVMNALHIPLGLLDGRMQDLQTYKNSAVVLVCRSGARSGQAAVKLKKQGFVDVHNMGGGMMAWERASLPTTTKTGKPPKPPKTAEPETSTPETSAPETMPVPALEKIADENEHKVLVYTTEQCPSCTRAIDLLKTKNIEYNEICIDKDTDKRSEMKERSGRTSAPQIFIGDVHVGDCDEMYALEEKDELNALLGLGDEPTTENKSQDLKA